MLDTTTLDPATARVQADGKLVAATPCPAPPRQHRTQPVSHTHRPRRSRGRSVYRAVLALIWLGVVGATLNWGLEYYLTPFELRPFSEVHDLFKPAGLIGLGFGIIGTAFITIGVGVYALRKRVPWLGGLGSLKYWLELHMFLCTLGPVLVLFHTAFRVTGIVSIAFWSMMVVGVSGLFGRYIYARIPKSINGQFMTLQQLREQKQELIDTITKDFGTQARQLEELLHIKSNGKPTGFLRAWMSAIRYNFTRRSVRKKIKRFLDQKPNRRGANSDQNTFQERPVFLRETVIGLVEEQIQLERRIALLMPFQVVFRFWHITHIPLSAIMFLVIIVHISIAVLFGYTWVF